MSNITHAQRAELAQRLASVAGWLHQSAPDASRAEIRDELQALKRAVDGLLAEI